MDNFDLKNFLIENQLTHNSQQLDEDLKSSVAAVMLLIGSLGAQAQMKPEYKAQIDSIQKVKTLTPQEKRAEIQKIVQLNRDDIKGKNDEVKQRAINSFLKFQRPDLVNASPEKILKAYTAWGKEHSKGDDQPYGDLNTSKDLKRAEKCRTVDGPSFLSKLNPFKEKNGCIYSDEDKSGVKK
jgi:hypothetical protein